MQSEIIEAYKSTRMADISSGELERRPEESNLGFILFPCLTYATDLILTQINVFNQKTPNLKLNKLGASILFSFLIFSFTKSVSESINNRCN